MDVLLLGPMPTPAIAMLSRSMRADLGVMISASHNAYDDNGIKLFGSDGYKLSDDVEREIERLVDTDMSKRLAKSADIGRVKRIDGAQDRYIEFAKRTLPRNQSLEGLRIVVDCANGAAYKVAPMALWELGAEVVSIGVDPDGFNINHECGSTAPQACAQKVREVRADIGIARDGDGDRVVIVDESGHLIDGDQLLAVIAESWSEDGRLAGDGVVATVMSNLGLERYLAEIGIKLVRASVGDRYVLDQMRTNGFNVGGDLRVTSLSTTPPRAMGRDRLQLLAVVETRPAMSKVCHRFARAAGHENVRYRSGKPLENAKVRSAIKSGEKRLNGHGRLVIRPSGTGR
jgi:phosphoglucosamine mutase